MPLHRVQALMLRKYPLGETDAILSLFTREFGRIRSVAKGALRSKSRWMGVFETANVVEFLLYRPVSGELYRVSQASVMKRFKNLLADFSQIQNVYEILEVLHRFTPDNEPQHEIYKLALSTLERCDQYPSKTISATTAFHLRFLALSGYAFRLDSCVLCAKPRLGKAAYLSSDHGGVLCSMCLKNQTHESPLLTRRMMEWVEAAQSGYEHKVSVHLSNKTFTDILKPLLNKTYMMHFGTGLRVWETTGLDENR